MRAADHHAVRARAARHAADRRAQGCTQVGVGGLHCDHQDVDTPCCYCGALAPVDEGGEA